MAREWLLRGVKPEELEATPREEIPETPRTKWENFWYHHKLKFWLILFAVVVLVIVVVQFIKRDEPDYHVLFISEKPYLDKELEELEEYLEKYGKDLDGDGKVEVHVENCCINADQSRNSSIQQIQAHLVAGDRLFFVWDPGAYDYFKENVINESDKGMDYLATITVQDAGLIEEGKVWSWSEDDRVSKSMKKRWPDLYFGVRAAGSSKESKALYKGCYGLLEALVSDGKQIIKKDDPDYRVLFVTEQTYLDNELDELASYLEAFGDDLDGDGKVEIQVENCCINADQSSNSSIQQIQAHLVTGDRLFFVWDPGAYDYFKENVINESDKGMDYLATITVQDAGLIEEGKVWSWSEDDRVGKAMKKRWPDLYFGVRAAGSSKESKALYKGCFGLLEALVADEKTKK